MLLVINYSFLVLFIGNIILNRDIIFILIFIFAFAGGSGIIFNLGRVFKQVNNF